MLDDLLIISGIDKNNQLEKLENIAFQIKESFEIVDSNEFEKIFKVDNIIFNGMGGSAISGDIIETLLRNKLNIPIFVNRSYNLPKWANKNTLVITQSYSGNTQETLSAFKQAYQKKCKIISISSGGKLQDYCKNRGIKHVKIPEGYIPRSAIAYFIFISLKIFEKIGIANNIIKIDAEEILEVINDIIKENNKNVPTDINPSKKIAKKILGTIPQIYGWDIYSPIAKRWSTQFNENSKLISKFDIVSESNHNDIVGWSQNPEISKKFSCILFRDKNLESIYMSTRLDFMKSFYSDFAANLIEINAKGKNSISKMIYTIYLGDFISCYLAILRKIDPTPVTIIDELKKRLNSI
jgi:glucose/mannose-6-phosphate isomerase